MSDNVVDVLIKFQQIGADKIQKQLDLINYQMKSLATVNETMVATTGKSIPATAQQVVVLKALAAQGNQAAQSLVRLKQGSNVFYQIFSGNVKQNLAALYKNEIAYKQTAATLRRELLDVQVVADKTTGRLVSLAEIPTAKVRIMGRVWAENQARIAEHLIATGKQAQWVGRQMIVGVTAPFLLATGIAAKFALELARERTELEKYGVTAASMGDAIDKLAVKLGIMPAELTNIASLWAAAGFTDPSVLQDITDLTAQTVTLAQGDIDLAGAMETVRTIMSVFHSDLKTQQEQLAATTKDMYDLQFVQSRSAITMQELASALPVVATALKRVGLSAGETGALLAGMRQRGIEANEAANALKFGLIRLVNPTKQAKETFEEFTGTDLGKVLFEGGEPKGIQALVDLAGQFKYLNQQQQLQLAGQLFQSRQANRMLALIDALNDKNSDASKMIMELNKQGNTELYWQQQLNTVLDGAAKKWEILKTRLVVFASKIGLLVLPMLTKTLERVIKLTEEFENLGPGFQKTTLYIGGFVAAMGPAIFMLGQFRLIWGNVRKLLLVSPFRALFNVVSMEDANGLQRLASKSKDQALKVVAGMPDLNTKMTLTAQEAAAAEELVTGALARQSGTVSALTLSYARLNATRAGLATLPGVAFGPEGASLFGANVGEDVIARFYAQQPTASDIHIMGKKLEQNYLTEIDRLEADMKSIMKSKRPMGDFGERFIGIPGSGYGGKIISKQQAEQMVQDYLQKLNAAKAGKAKDFEKLMALVPKGSMEASQLAAVAGMVTGSAYAKGAEEAIVTAAPIENAIMKETKNTSKIKGMLSNFFAFWKQINLTTVVPGQGPFTMMETVLNNTIGKFLIFSAALLVLAKNWKNIWEGLKPGVDFVKSKMMPVLEKAGKVIAEAFTGKTGSGFADIFVKLGEVIGNTLEILTEFVLRFKLIETSAQLIAGAVKVVINAFESLFAILLGLLQLITGQFSDALNSFGKGLGLVGQKASFVVGVFGKVIALLIGLLVFSKAAVVVMKLVRSFQALGLVIQGMQSVSGVVPKLAQGLFSMRVGAAAASEGVAGMVNPLMAVLAVIGLIIAGFILWQATIHKTNEALKELQASADELGAAFVSLKDVAMSTFLGIQEGSVGSIDRFRIAAQKFKVSMAEIIRSTSTELGGLVTLPEAVLKKQLAQLTELQAQVDAANRAAAGTGKLGTVKITPELSNILGIQEGITSTFYLQNTLSEKLKELTAQTNVYLQVRTEFLDQIGSQMERLRSLSAAQLLTEIRMNQAHGKHLNDLLLSLRDLRDAETDPAAVDALNEKIRVILEQISLNDLLIGQLQDLVPNAQMRDPWVNWFNALAQDAKEAGQQMGANMEQGLLDAITGQLDQLTDRVTSSIMQTFDRNATAQMNALSDAQQAQMDALEKAQQNQLDAFDKNADAQMAAFDKMAEAKVGAIDKQIQALQDQNAAEDWLAKQEEYRANRAALLLKASLNAAINFRERMKAIAEGRFDDARLLELQGMQQGAEDQQGIKDLDDQHMQDIADHEREIEIQRLQDQKTFLQDQLDQQRDALQAQIDAQREALQEQLDNQKNALQDQLDAEREAAQARIDQQRETLSNLLSELNEFHSSSKAEWLKHYQEMLGIAKQFGIDMVPVENDLAADWQKNVVEQIADALDDAGKLWEPAAEDSAADAGDGFQAGIAGWDLSKILTWAGSVASIYDQWQKLLAIPTGSQTSTDQLNAAIAEKSLMLKLQSALNAFHGGGYVGGSGGEGKEKIAKVLTGEYVMQPQAVKHWGKGFMDSINEYHSGGLVEGGGGWKTGGLMDHSASIIAGSHIGRMLQGVQGKFYWGVLQHILSGVNQYQAAQQAAGGYYPPGSAGTGSRVNGLTVPELTYKAAAFGSFSGLINMGEWVIKKILGSDSWSQHSYGNAIDIGHLGWPGALYPLWNWVLANVGKFHVAHAIFDHKTWSNTNPTVHPYTGLNPHENHVHVDFLPQWAGNPGTYSNPGGYPVMASGGILKSPGLFYGGENHRKEAVIPLESRRGIIAIANAMRLAFAHVPFDNRREALHYADEIMKRYKLWHVPQFHHPRTSVPQFSLPPVHTANVAQTGNVSNDNVTNLHIHGDFYGDENSYKKLYDTLKKVGDRAQKTRGGNTKINITRTE